MTAPFPYAAECRATRERNALTDDVAGIIQRACADPLSAHDVAAEILDHLVSAGMLPPYMVRALVLAAGGRVALPVDAVADAPGSLAIFQAQHRPYAPIVLQVNQ